MLPNTETTFKAEADGYEAASEPLSLPEEADREITLVLKKKSTDAAVDKAQEAGGAPANG